MRKNMSNPFTLKEKEIIQEELTDVLDHYDSLLEAKVFETEIEKEEVIDRVQTLENILKKV
jgi:hypothetical protein